MLISVSVETLYSIQIYFMKDIIVTHRDIRLLDRNEYREQKCTLSNRRSV